MKLLVILASLAASVAFADLPISVPSPLAKGGSEGTGGGLEAEAEFVAAANSLNNLVLDSNRKGEGLFINFNHDAYTSAVLSKEVFAKKTLCVSWIDSATGATDVKCPDGFHDGTLGVIYFDETKWARKTCVERYVLVAHEYGRAAGIERGNYRFSALIKKSKVIQQACQSETEPREMLACRDTLKSMSEIISTHTSALGSCSQSLQSGNKASYRQWSSLAERYSKLYEDYKQTCHADCDAFVGTDFCEKTNLQFGCQ